jgi:NAD(P)-dependent dehydrogenase (short-subunit alcohol dehydrogenase family)
MAVAVVTGGTRGVGRGIVRALEGRGHRVAADQRSVERLRADVESKLGTVSILVNAAGVFGPLALLADSDPAAWTETIRVNLLGTYLTCRAFVPGMLAAGWGRVINVSSASALHRPGPLASAYCVSKIAVNQLTRQLAAEIANSGVTANAIHPGDLKTDMWSDIKAQVEELGPVADEYRRWADRVGRTGGDAVEKAGHLVVEIVESDVNGYFLWIDDPMQTPIPSWRGDEPAAAWES